MNIISEETRRRAIQLWLQGESRNDIAVSCGIGDGTVSGIVDDWRRRLDYGDADALRELTVSIKRSGIDATQCA